MDIGVIGGGSIGLLVSCYLQNHHEVTLYVRRNGQVKSIQNKSVELFEHKKLKSSHRIKTEHISNLQAKDVMIICVKQHQLKDVIELLPENQAVIFLQNGMGHVPLMKKRSHSYIGIVEHGAVRKNDYQVVHLGNGKITLSSVTGDDVTCRKLVHALDQHGFLFHFEHDWEFLLKEKLIINAVINPLTALFNVPNHAIRTNKHIRKLACHLCNETAAVLHLDGQTYWEKIMEIAKNTGNNMSSMRADILNNRKSEIDSITGYILQHSNAHLPYTSFVYRAILALEAEGNE